MTDDTSHRLETATFGAGCFWGVEETFRQVPGVKSTVVGYSGGWSQDPTYKDVCSGRTGHAEVVQVTYDPADVSYEELLRTFWESHDPIGPNGEGWDAGAQYRSAIFFRTPEQESIARQSKDELDRSGQFRDKVATEISPASTFYRAEEYHQQYFAKQRTGAGRR
jgi:peptide-methionine (S)-S-oxide reductase